MIKRLLMTLEIIAGLAAVYFGGVRAAYAIGERGADMWVGGMAAFPVLGAAALAAGMAYTAVAAWIDWIREGGNDR